ncbi:class I SAM-dependent methyltransferase [Mesorhizobium sp. M0152]|uniref:class I SAM-dependent methyltransferase n=1 Tax=Mesorhizobium sp. M0152 TaxID=2956898 RepID=UPI00333D9F96
MPEQLDRRARFPTDLDLSPYVRSCLRRLPKTSGLDVLDIPSGFGRHSLFLAAQDNQVVAADIDQHRLDQSLASWRTLMPRQGNLRPVLVDAEQSLPFSREAFDLVLVVHYVSDKIIEAVCPLIRAGGFLVYETFSAHGLNSRNLPIAGQTANRVSGFEVLDLRERPVRSAAGEVVTVKMLARKLATAKPPLRNAPQVS